MATLKRPNDVWLRLWLIVIWGVLCWANTAYILPLMGKPPIGIFKFLYVMEIVLFSLLAVALLLAVWYIFKRPDCKCWDDIKTKPKAKRQNPRVADVDCFPSGGEKLN